MRMPVEMEAPLPIGLDGGGSTTTQKVWSILTACVGGDIDAVREHVEKEPKLGCCKFDYTSPLHLAVREGHLEIVQYLVANGALESDYRVHPFRDTLTTIASDRGHDEIVRFVTDSLADPSLVRKIYDNGRVDFGRTPIQMRLHEHIDRQEHAEVKAILKDHPKLALDRYAFWGEGILAGPANNDDQAMLELLMGFGARVPEMSKWAARYYFKHLAIGEFLLINGMDPNHMNWRGFTLLHDMAFTGEVAKAGLLLDHGADIDPIDDEYASTPLAYAARWGHSELVKMLLAHGADPNASGAPWSTPRAWAKRKGRDEIAAVLAKLGTK